MPQVPIAQMPGYQQSGDNYYVRQTMANGRNDNWLQAGASMSQGLRQVGGVVQELYQRKRMADDFDNAGQIKFMIEKERDDIQQWMVENANDYESFEKHNEEAINKLTTRLLPYQGKLSLEASREMKLYLEDQTLRMRSFARGTAFQADLKVKKDNLVARMEYQCRTGDYKTAREEVNNALTSGLVSEALAFQLNKKIDNDVEYYDGVRKIDDGDLAVIDQLKQRNESGKYVNFKNLSMENRHQLLGYAQSVKAKRDMEQRDAFVADVQAGKAISEESIQRRSDIDQGLKNDFVAAIRRRNAQIAAAERAVTKEQRQELQRRNAADKEVKTFARDTLEGEIMDYPFSSDPNVRRQEVDTFEQRIFNELGTEYPGFRNQVKRQLAETVNAIEKPDTGYKNTSIYQYGTGYIQQLEVQGQFYALEKGWFWDGHKKDSKTSTTVRDMVKLGMDHFVQSNPDANQEQIKNYIDTLKTDLNRTEVDGLLNKTFQHITVTQGEKKERHTPTAGTIVNGYLFQGGDPADKANWEEL